MRPFRNMLAWCLRVHRKGAAVRRLRAARVRLAELDARTLKDIGLEEWSSPLGARIALRPREFQ